MSDGNQELATGVSMLGGGVVGAVTALAVRPPATVREGLWRTIAGSVAAITCTGWTCEYLHIEPTTYYKVVGVAIGIGFCGWHAFSAAMVLLDAALETTQREKFGAVLTVIRFFRGGKGNEQ